MATLLQRASLIQEAKFSTTKQAALMELCRRDPRFWFNCFAYTFDPRLDQPHQPFELYDYQVGALLRLCESIDKGHDLLVEKSRDMGISWLVLLTFLYYWRFRPGANFHLGSRKQESVDRKGDISTLFEKLRYAMDWLPPWMMPAGFNETLHDNFLKLENPENGNVITGESANDNFGRGGRYKAVLFDEFPFWPQASLAFASAGQSTPCRVVVGTPYGKANRFADLRFGGDIEILTFHWTQHPLKDEAWYQEQKKRATKDEIARELDISYEHSVEGIVFGEFTESHVSKDAYQFDPYLQTIVAFDFGRTAATLFAQMDGYGRLHVFKEIVTDPAGSYGYKGENTDDQAGIARGFLSVYDLKSPLSTVCDPAGNSPDHRTRSTDVKTLDTYGFRNAEFSKAIKMKDRLNEGVKLLKKALANRISGEESIIIYEAGCPKLIESFRSGYRYKQDHAGNITDKIQEDHPYEDVMDCLRYMVIEKMSQAPVKIPARRKTSGSRYTSY